MAVSQGKGEDEQLQFPSGGMGGLSTRRPFGASKPSMPIRRASCFYARRGLEIAVAWLYAHDKAFQPPYQDSLSALIFEPSFRKQVGEALFAKARLIKDLGNLAVHSHKRVAESDALTAPKELFHFCFWMARRYGRQARPAPSLTFSAQLLPQASGQSALSQTERRSPRQDHHLRQEQRPRRLHRRALQCELPGIQRALRPGHHLQD